MDEFNNALEKQMEEWSVRLVIAGYKACCKSIIEMIDENVPIEQIKAWCGTSHKNANIVDKVMYNKEGDNIDKD